MDFNGNADKLAMKSYNSSFRNSNSYIYLVGLNWGAVRYALKLVSIVKISEFLSLAYFPILMLAQSALFFLSIKPLEKLAERGQSHYFLVSILMGALTVFSIFWPGEERANLRSYAEIFSCVIFLLSTFSLMVIEIGVHNYIGSKGSILKNPNLSFRTTFSIETGYLFAAVLSYAVVSNPTENILIRVVPFFVLLAMLLSNPSSLLWYEPKEKSNGSQVKYYPFISLLLVLTVTVFFTKNMQIYATFKGVIDLKNEHNTDTTFIFSVLSIIETALVLLVLIYGSLIPQKGTNWVQGFKIYLLGQALSFGILIFYSPALALVSSNVLRRVTENSFLNISRKILDASIPSRIRFHVKNFVENRASGLAFLLVALVTLITMGGVLPDAIVWFASFVASGVGIWTLYRLVYRLTDFHIANIATHNVDDCLSAFYSLANDHSAAHNFALLAFLDKNPRPVIEKAVIYALGEMGNPENIAPIMRSYEGSDREDIKLEAIRALLKFPQYEVDLFLTRTYEHLIRNDLSLGTMKRRLIELVSTRDKTLSILSVYKIYAKIKDKENVDDRVLANLVEIIGLLGEKYQDRYLLDLTSTFLDLKYSRRVVFNAIKHLYPYPSYKAKAQKYLDLFLTSEDKKDRGAVAYIAGHLKLHGLLPFIVKNSEDLNHKNSTLLISLIKLEYEPAFTKLAQFIIQEEEMDAVTALGQLNSVEKISSRLRVYFEVLAIDISFANKLLKMLRETKKEFTVDRDYIMQELFRHGIAIDQEQNTIFLEKAEINLG